MSEKREEKSGDICTAIQTGRRSEMDIPHRFDGTSLHVLSGRSHRVVGTHRHVEIFIVIRRPAVIEAGQHLQ